MELVTSAGLVYYRFKLRRRGWWRTPRQLAPYVVRLMIVIEESRERDISRYWARSCEEKFHAICRLPLWIGVAPARLHGSRSKNVSVQLLTQSVWKKQVQSRPGPKSWPDYSARALNARTARRQLNHMLLENSPSPGPRQSSGGRGGRRHLVRGEGRWRQLSQDWSG
jgi:hypothetical protein